MNQLAEACKQLRTTLIGGRPVSLYDVYDAVLEVAGESPQGDDQPVVFSTAWRKDEYSKGLRRHVNGTWVGFDLTECGGRRVILLEHLAGQDYLQAGIDALRASNARSIGLMTSRLQFPPEELRCFKQKLSWVLVTDELGDMQPHIERHCRGKLRAFPVPYRRMRAA